MLTSRTPTPCALALACLIGLFLPVQSSDAQQWNVPRLGSTEASEQDPMAQLRQRLQQSTATSSTLAMEGAVDPDEYRVGPGDVFMISIGGPQPTAMAVPVSADGRLVLPDGEVIPADGRVLREVRDEAFAALQRRYRNIAVGASLAQPRQFFVHVSGAVPVPGRYLAIPMARVSDLIQMAYADTLNVPVSNLNYRPSLRNIQVARRSGDTVAVDLALYLSTGDTGANPYVRDGDVIRVPAYKPSERAIFVNGAVPFPGAYDYRPGDRLVDLLQVAGLSGYDDVGSIRLARQATNGRVSTTTHSAAELRSGISNVPLQPLDNISVDPVRRISGTVEVEGFVQFPGEYAIEPGSTTLQDLLAMSGGVRDDALVHGAYLVRDVLPSPTVDAGRQNRYERQMLDMNRLRPDTVAVMQYLRQSDLDFISRTQFAQGLRIQNRVSVDLEEVLAGNATPVYLQDGDRLVVPHDRQFCVRAGGAARFCGVCRWADSRRLYQDRRREKHARTTSLRRRSEHGALP